MGLTHFLSLDLLHSQEGSIGNGHTSTTTIDETTLRNQPDIRAYKTNYEQHLLAN